MNLTLTKMRHYARSGLAVVAGLMATVAVGNAYAGNVGISVGIHVPAAPLYVVPSPPPPPLPRVHYYQPAPPPVAYYSAPAPYGYWAPPPPPRGHGKHFKHRPPKPHHRHHSR